MTQAATPATEATPPPPVEANDSQALSHDNAIIYHSILHLLICSSAQAKFAAADVNGDGRLSAAEVLATLDAVAFDLKVTRSRLVSG